MAHSFKTLAVAAVAIAIAGVASAQAVSTPSAAQLADSRLPVSTLVREDLFDGFLANDMASLAKGEANLAKLYDTRPDARPETRAWQAGALIYRAVLAREAGKTADYASLYARAMADLDEADLKKATQPAVMAIGGGVGVLFGDRVAPADRAALWNRTYGYFQGLTAAQAPVVDKLPVHIRGESLAGLAVSAQRSGHAAEADAAIDHMLPLVKGTPYEADAVKWKADPAARPAMTLACKSCHDDGRLAPTVTRLPAAGA